MDGFEWDEAKNAANRAKHGLSFAEAAAIWQGPVLTGPDVAHRDEPREISFGLIGATTVVCVVHTERHGKIRIISARKATRSERAAFDARLRQTQG